MKIEGASGFAEQLRMLERGSGIKPPKSIISEQQDENTPKTSFADMLKNQIGEVNKLGIEADQAIQDAVAGKEDNPHTTMIAMQKADISFRLLLSVKERIEQAYQQIVRTQIG